MDDTCIKNRNPFFEILSDRQEAIVARDLRTEIFEQILSFVIRTIITEQPGIKYDNKILSWLKIKINLG